MLLSTDFTGYFRIAQDNATKAQLDLYITKYEKKYLVDLLGYELYLLFIASFTGSPSLPTGRFLTIYNELYYDENSGDCVFIPSNYNPSEYARKYRAKVPKPTLSDGIKKMLLGFIYFEFVNEYGLNVSQTGVVSNKNENADKDEVKALELVESRHNDAIRSYQVIQNYIKGNSSDWPEFKGVEKNEVYWGGAF